MSAHITTCPKCHRESSSERDILDKVCRTCGFYTDKDAGMFFLSQGYELPIKKPLGWCGIQPMVMGEYDVLVGMTHDFIRTRIGFKTQLEAYAFLTAWDGITMPEPGNFGITKIK